MTYAASFSTITGRTTIHAAECSTLAGLRTKRGCAIQMIEAPDAKAAAKAITEREELIERDFPAATVCKCAKAAR